MRDSGYITTWRVLVLVLLIVIVGGGVAVAYVLRSPGLPTAVTAYEFPVIDRSNPPVCPGDTVAYDQTARITQTPAAVLVVETVWSISENRTVIPDYDPFWLNHWQPFTGSGHVEWPVPDLAAGDYEFRRSTTAFGRRTEMFVVTFTVAEGC